MKNKWTYFIYIILIFSWVSVCIWQFYEHRQVVEMARDELRNKARDISEAVSIVIRSQRGGRGRDRNSLMASLRELVDSTNLESVMLLNSAGKVRAVFGKPIRLKLEKLDWRHEYWEKNYVVFANLVALGDSDKHEFDRKNGKYDKDKRFEEEPPPPLEKLKKFPLGEEDLLNSEGHDRLIALMDGKPLDDKRMKELWSAFKPGLLDGKEKKRLKKFLYGKPLTIQSAGGLLQLVRMINRRRNGGFRHMSHRKMHELIKKRGIHSFVVMLPTSSVTEASLKDIRGRMIVLFIALTACIALGIAVRITAKSFELQLKLTRAQDTAEYLKDQNMAAAGLVHETKNPLNIIRGLAQLISKEEDYERNSGETALKIIEEVDRVTGRINQFLDYSKPRDAQKRNVNVKQLVKEVFTLLEYDSREKGIELLFTGSDITLSADKEMLRQLLFNLVMNAVEAVDENGRITVRVGESAKESGIIEVCDNGNGVPDELKEEIFRPYYTTGKDGTGLGLTVVKQIVMAHEWNIEVVKLDNGENVFRITGIKQGENDGGL